jgi:protein FRA10AC1
LSTPRQFALRWRSEAEVLSGTGERSCGNTRCALHLPLPGEDEKIPGLTTLELPFDYEEHGHAKTALVKVVLCAKCVKKLGWKREHDKREAAATAAATAASANASAAASTGAGATSFAGEDVGVDTESPRGGHASASRTRRGRSPTQSISESKSAVYRRVGSDAESDAPRLGTSRAARSRSRSPARRSC